MNKNPDNGETKMVVFDFEQSAKKSVLKFSGSLLPGDVEELEGILYRCLARTTHLLVIEHGSVTEIGTACLNVFFTANQNVYGTGKCLVFTITPVNNSLNTFNGSQHTQHTQHAQHAQHVQKLHIPETVN
ncbi:MAG: hypothetical protein GY757_47675 [bacterium]|nr:hypothetical protein [bacterium]